MTTALFGLAPALRASSVAPMTALKTGGAGFRRRAGVMRPFVAVQVAFGLVVLFVGGLLVLSFARLSSVNPGFRHVERADVVDRSRPAYGGNRAADRSASSARSASLYSRRPGGKLRRIQRARPGVDLRRACARIPAARNDRSGRWRRSRRGFLKP